MANLAFIIAIALFGVGFVTLLTAALMKNENARRFPIRLVGMFSTGASFLTMGVAFVLTDVLARHLTAGSILFGALALYFGYDTIRKGLTEMRAARKPNNS